METNMYSSLRKTRSVQHSPLKSVYGKTYYKRTVVIVGFDVKRALDAAWWPCMLSNLRDLRCPKILYNLTLNYFRDRVASLQANTHTEKRTEDRPSSRLMLWPRVLEHHVQ
jgi:hypothetical protein